MFAHESSDIIPLINAEANCVNIINHRQEGKLFAVAAKKRGYAAGISFKASALDFLPLERAVSLSSQGYDHSVWRDRKLERGKEVENVVRLISYAKPCRWESRTYNFANVIHYDCVKL